MAEGSQGPAHTLYIAEDKAGLDFTTRSEAGESGGGATATPDQSIFTTRVHPPLTATGLQSTDAQRSPKPLLSYVALIAKVILSSPSQKLNLGSIYKVMVERFPQLKSRGPGWRNSVRHNLSVNDCFVKVSRCEDGRGHYWGVHPAHLKDFQHGNFKRHRNTRGRRRREPSATWMDTDCQLLGRLSGNRWESGLWVEAQRPLEDPKRQQGSFYEPWSVSVGLLKLPGSMRSYCFPDGLSDLSIKAQYQTFRHHWWQSYPVQKGMAELCDSRVVMSPVQPLSWCSWCMCPVMNELINPLAFKVGF